MDAAHVSTLLIAVLVRIALPHLHEYTFYAVVFGPLLLFYAFAPREDVLSTKSNQKNKRENDKNLF